MSLLGHKKTFTSILVFLFFASCQTSLFRENSIQDDSLPEVSVNSNVQSQNNEDKQADNNATLSHKTTTSNNIIEENKTSNATIEDNEKTSYEPPQISLPTKTAKQTKQPVHYRGDVFVREIKYHRRVKKKTPVLTIKGNVRVSQGSTVLYARKIEIVGNNGEFILAPQGVRVVDKNTQVQGNYAEYHRNSKRVFLKGNCKVRSGRKQKVEIRSNEMEYDFLSQVSYARGNVTTKAHPYSGTSKQAMYQQKLDLFRFVGDAFVYHETTTYHAQEISLQQKTNAIEMKHNVSIWHYEYEGKEKKSTNHIIADHAKRTGQGKELKTELFSNEKKQVQLTNDEIFFHANYAVLYGEQQLEATGNITVTDRKEGHYIRAEKASSSADGKIIQFFSVVKSQNNIVPNIVLMDQDKNPSVSIQAHHLEKNSVIKKWNARGQMQAEILSFENKERNNENYTRKESIWLGGEWAEMKEGSTDVYLFGSPYVTQENKKIYSREIIINKDKRTVQLKGSIQTSSP